MSSRREHWRVFHRQRNVSVKVLSSALTGIGCRSVTQVPLDCLQNVDKTESFIPSVVVSILHRLEGAASQMEQPEAVQADLKLLMKRLWQSEWNLRFHRNLRYEEEPNVDCNDTNKRKRLKKVSSLAQQLQLVGAFPIIFTILSARSLFPGGSHGSKSVDSDVLGIKCLCLDILYRTCVMNEEVANEFAEIEDLLHCCFQLLTCEGTVKSAAALLEELLQVRKEPMQLSTVPNLFEALSRMEGSEVHKTCGVLGLTISDLDMMENTLLAQSEKRKTWQQQNRQRVLNANQEFLLSVPDFLFKISQCATHMPYNPLLSSSCIEREQWIQWIEDRLSNNLDNEVFVVADIEDPVMINSSHERIEQVQLTVRQPLSPDPRQATFHHHFPSSASDWNPAGALASMTAEHTMRVQSTHILGLFMAGRAKKEVQRRLALSGFARKMDCLFQKFLWRGNHSNFHLGCGCNPEVALKIQLLRLLHSFCESGEHHHLLLNPEEWTEMQMLSSTISQNNCGTLSNNATYRIYTCPPPELQQLMCDGGQGLISRVVDVLKNEPPQSFFRFWLCRTVEGFMRGSCHRAEQLFLLRRGLLDHVLDTLLWSGSQYRELQQSGFDLLGEMLKFNMDAFQKATELLEEGEKAQKLLQRAMDNLVDSNMLMRSLILSLHAFQQLGKKEKPYLFCQQCPLLTPFIEPRQQVQYLLSVLRQITVPSLTQENISCLNTMLVILIQAQQQWKLEEYLQIIVHILKESNDPGRNPLSLLQVFRELLLFWQEHYLSEYKDCSSLQKSCRINLDCWKQVVQMLASNDPRNPLSLMYYMVRD